MILQGHMNMKRIYLIYCLMKYLKKRVISYENALRQIAAQAMLSGIPVPAMANAISYLDLFTKKSCRS